MAFVLDWKEKLGYRDDPFLERPAGPVSAYFVDREQEREALNLFIIKRGRIGILQGPKGSGKTTILAWLAEELAAHQKKLTVLRLADEKLLADKNAFAHALVDPHLSILERNVTKPHQTKKPEEREALIASKLGTRHVVLLIDNASELAKENEALLVRLLAACPGLQVILSLERVLKEHEAMGEDALCLTLDEMPEEALEELLTRRIALVCAHAPFPFDDAEMRKLIANAKRSPGKLLALAHERAIELSLKVAGPPAAAPKKDAPKKEADKEAIKAIAKEPVKKADAKKETKSAQDEEALLAAMTEDVPSSASEEKPKKSWFSIKFAKDEDEDGSSASSSSARESAKTGKASSSAKNDDEIDSALLDKVLADAVTAQETKPAAVDVDVADEPKAKKAKSDEKKAEEKDDAEKKLSRSGIIKGGRRR